MPTKINLLPHREATRKERNEAFLAMLLGMAGAGVGVILAVSAIIGAAINTQNDRNAMIVAENAKLDIEIAEIATLKEEITALKARKQAVEDLQSDRNQPVYILDELVKHVPEGAYLRSFKQVGQNITLNGYAHSNERVSELLRNLGNVSAWLERPELVEIRAASVGQGKDLRRLFEFSMNVSIKRATNADASAAGGKAAAANPATRP